MLPTQFRDLQLSCSCASCRSFNTSSIEAERAEDVFKHVTILTVDYTHSSIMRPFFSKTLHTVGTKAVYMWIKLWITSYCLDTKCNNWPHLPKSMLMFFYSNSTTSNSVFAVHSAHVYIQFSNDFVYARNSSFLLYLALHVNKHTSKRANQTDF